MAVAFAIVTIGKKGPYMPSKKKVAGYIRFQIQAGVVTPAPPIGPVLGQHGVNIMEFCKAYNAAMESRRGNVIPVEITVYEDRPFTFVTKMSPAVGLIKKAAGVTEGSSTPHNNKVGHLAAEQLHEITKTKESDLDVNDLDNATCIIAGAARSMGVTSDEI